MKDVTITSKRIKFELWTLLACFIIAFGLNIYAVINYNAPTTEILTSLGFVVCTTIVIYVVWCVLRLIGYGIKALFIKKKK